LFTEEREKKLLQTVKETAESASPGDTRNQLDITMQLEGMVTLASERLEHAKHPY
jgi:hypothetical protein